ncbi:RNA-binding protein, predicted [Thermodesulfatator indicus DSM 15286]|uniref:RNA-binding protein, predicted n=1 Tax=Thermodesulfatator indicus (strain DSM 15286 / JCM 11887 / CIR29812) TaxID=667014 RepID=F8ACI6_THEID|nr:CooT family nickel-binding protein [Thermodesulfatator indicus]AEH44689.1 RNA-binding protein, predicted [Thermodesulfatator indicus DSM 15286]
MCQAKAFWLGNGQEEEIMNDVIEIEVKPDGLVLKSFFEEPKKVEGEIVAIDFLKHKVFIKPKGSNK